MYFDQAGQVNTVQTLKAAAERGRALGLDEIVLATTTGDTAHEALVLKPAHAARIFDLRIREVVCKPRVF